MSIPSKSTPEVPSKAIFSTENQVHNGNVAPPQDRLHPGFFIPINTEKRPTRPGTPMPPRFLPSDSDEILDKIEMPKTN